MFDAQRVKSTPRYALIGMTFLLSLSGSLSDQSRELLAQGLDARAVAFAVEKQLINAIEKSEKSVVAISKIKTRRQQLPSRIPAPFGLDLNQRLNSSHDPQNLNFIPNDFGSGVLIPDPTKQNRVLILTNYHLTQDGPVAGQKTLSENRIYVHTAKRQGFYAEILAADPRSDLSVLTPIKKLTRQYTQSLLPIKYGSTKSIRKGQFVIALGNPYAIARDGSPSASWGIVSNFHRYPIPIKKHFLNQELDKKETLHHFGTLLQVDTHLDLGTSGGALLDLDGNLIGVTTALAALEGYEKSTGYAIPINKATLRIIDSLAAGLEPEYGFLGIQPQTIEQDRVKQRFFGNIALQEPFYVEADSVTPFSPAQIAGMLPHDLILSVDGQKLTNELDLMREVGKAGAGNEVKVQILRGKKPHELTLTIKLGKWPVTDDEGIVQTQFRYPLWRGMRVDYPTARKKYTFLPFSYPPAVVVTHVEPGSPAQKAGLKEGNFIKQINNQMIQTPEAFNAEAKKLNSSQVILQLLDDRKVILPLPDK